jgi:hypothetical protein
MDFSKDDAFPVNRQGVARFFYWRQVGPWVAILLAFLMVCSLSVWAHLVGIRHDETLGAALLKALWQPFEGGDLVP